MKMPQLGRIPPSSPGRHRPQGSAVRNAAAIVLALAGAAAIFSSSLDGEELSSGPSLARRSLKQSKSRGMVLKQQAQECGYPVHYARTFRSESDVEPTVAASYPGSGARMTWMLVQSLTGQATGDEWNFGKQGDKVVTMKTHHPHPMGKKRDWPREIPRAILLLRNPADAIPSFHNFLYEVQHKLEGHSTRAPHDEWVNWRDSSATDGELRGGGFERLLASWVNSVKYWMNSYPREGEHRLTLAYEDLIGDNNGINTTLELGGFLEKAKGVEMIPDPAIECTWHRVVKGNDAPRSLRNGEKQRRYKRKQLDLMVSALDELEMKYENEGKLVGILRRYRSNIIKRPAEEKGKHLPEEVATKMARR
uniref:Sulfotransferase domain-containing protein n=2 Tax=Odontella aurita TaxID=265563 RepID=A0A7S4N2Q0_9STRA|mmetsp:Transcript_44574/g.135906  ORF Transcript_44574/g.135906 Transcript_44574/m.135906 type:complete len:364 (+) Transcript_44574:315-1406(+)